MRHQHPVPQCRAAPGTNHSDTVGACRGGVLARTRVRTGVALFLLEAVEAAAGSLATGGMPSLNDWAESNPVLGALTACVARVVAPCDARARRRVSSTSDISAWKRDSSNAPESSPMIDKGFEITLVIALRNGHSSRGLAHNEDGADEGACRLLTHPANSLPTSATETPVATAKLAALTVSMLLERPAEQQQISVA